MYYDVQKGVLAENNKGQLVLGASLHTLCNDAGSVVMQFTGLKDKKSKEIYEGDIVLRNETSCEGSYIAKYKVIYEKSSFCLEVLQSHIFKKGAVIYVMEECEVIGNIYENPELLYPPTPN